MKTGTIKKKKDPKKGMKFIMKAEKEESMGVKIHEIKERNKNINKRQLTDEGEQKTGQNQN